MPVIIQCYNYSYKINVKLNNSLQNILISLIFFVQFYLLIKNAKEKNRKIPLI